MRRLVTANAFPRRRQPLLDEPLPRTRRAHGARGERQPVPHARSHAHRRARITGAACCRACGCRRRCRTRPTSLSKRPGRCSICPTATRLPPRLPSRGKTRARCASRSASEMWEQINRLYLAVRRDVPDPGWTGRTHEFLTSVIEGVHLFQGITDATMTHGEGLALHRARPVSSSVPARRPPCSTCTIATSPPRRCSRPASASTSSGWACCDRAAPSKPTAVSTPPICAPTGSPSSCS